MEDTVSSRLLQDLARETAYAGLHVVTARERLDVDKIAAPLGRDGAVLAPASAQTYEVVLLTEA